MGNMSNGMNPNQQIPNSMDNIPNRMNQNQQIQNGMVNTMSQMSGQYNMNNVPNGMNQQINPQYASQSMENTNPQYTGRSMNFGETTVLDGNMTNGETSVLSAPAVVQPYLLRKKNGEKIFINNPFFRIGKEANYVDYFIGDNSAISRSHANIINSGKEYYIIDTNSKNHTYVNGQMIQSNTETLLTHGSIVKLANEEFEFRMY